MHYPTIDIHPDARARSGMLSELARNWSQRLAGEQPEGAAPSTGAEGSEELDDGPR